MEQRRRASDVNKELMRRLYDEVINTGEVDRADELVADDLIEHEEFPGITQGLTGFKQFFGQLRTSFPDIHFAVQDMVAEGDTVAALVTVTGTQEGEFLGIPPTGRSIRLTAIDIIRFDDGKAVEHWGVTDALAMMEQLGVTPARAA